MIKKENIEKRLLEFIKKNNLIDNNDKILVGVSGGVDSVTLLFLLLEISKYFKNLEFGVAHVNYKLRGEDSDKDQKLVENICKKNNLPLYIHQVKNPEYLKKNSLQVKAREIRYKFYSKLSEKYGYTKIALAHNANDNAETFLLNIFRGTGIDGLKGIPVIRDNIIRPLLFLSRNEILEYAIKNKIRYRHDKSNFKDDYDRNFLRLKVIPLIIKRINNNTVENINHLSKIFNDFSTFVDEYVKNAYKSVCSQKSSYEISLDIKKLNNYIYYIKEKVILSAYYNLTKETLSFNKVLKILNLLESQSGKRLILNKNIVLWKDRNSLIFQKKRNFEEKKLITLKIGDSVNINDIKLKISKASKPIFNLNPKIEYIDEELVSNNFILRKWKDGDYFYPFGMNGRKKISDFLTDIKISSSEKNNVWVLLNNDKIVWIVGLRLDNRFRCNEKTKKYLKLEMIKEE
ncbi:MAG TPA: tRNA lysidine(34) synthetase TilS [Bacteroidota bacterium]|nr:tRNA lysidine(34) synthetase TilS [Bacteroidota bacterium]